MSRLMRRLVHEREWRILPVMGSPRVYRPKAVMKRIKENTGKIEIFYLPGYPLELNRNELLNACLQ